jgi:hypothetical protein
MQLVNDENPTRLWVGVESFGDMVFEVLFSTSGTNGRAKHA